VDDDIHCLASKFRVVQDHVIIKATSIGRAASFYLSASTLQNTTINSKTTTANLT
jgi:hypothetical protein